MFVLSNLMFVLLSHCVYVVLFLHPFVVKFHQVVFRHVIHARLNFKIFKYCLKAVKIYQNSSDSIP